MKRATPPDPIKVKHVERYVLATPSEGEEIGTSHHQQHLQSTMKPARPMKRRKHNDSISESILIREKLPSSSLATIGKNNNVLIPRRNNHNILNSIDLKGTDGAAIKKLMNNNNGDLINGGSGDGFNNDDDDDEMDDSDSETVTGDESLFEPEEEEIESDEEYLDDEEEEIDRKLYSNKKKNSIVTQY